MNYSQVYPCAVGALSFILCRTTASVGALLSTKDHDEYCQIENANKARKKRLSRTYETASFKNFTI